MFFYGFLLKYYSLYLCTLLFGMLGYFVLLLQILHVDIFAFVSIFISLVYSPMTKARSLKSTDRFRLSHALSDARRVEAHSHK